MPLMSFAAIVKAGESFKIDAALDGKEVVKAILMVSGAEDASAALDLRNPADYEGVRTWRAIVPESTPESLYDLVLTFEDGSFDRQPNSVKVVKEFKKKYIFAHMTDIHFNLGLGNPADKRYLIRERILNEITALNPEFVLFGGDLGLYPETYDRDYVTAYENFRDKLKVPVIMTPGNHEMYIDKRGSAPIDGMDYWKAAFGPLYHSFNYGNLHVMSINTFDWPARWRNRYDKDVMATGSVGFALIDDAQWKWLREDVAKASAQGDNIIAFTHIPIELLQGGNRFGIEKPEKLGGPSASSFIKFLDKYKISHVFVGHIHMDSIRQLTDNVIEAVTLGAGHNSKLEDELWGYRIVYVEDGKIVDMKTISIGKDGI
jgi:3',5'-cyclic AMP phosphodiesterase CpdA